jgi:uncharacterized protein YrrD
MNEKRRLYMRIDLNATVYDRSGDKVGTVDRIVVDPTTKEIAKFIVGRGFLSGRDTIVDLEMVSRIDDDGIHLELTPAQVDQLPEYVEDQFTPVEENERPGIPFMAPNAGGAGMYLWGSADTGRGYDDGSSLFASAPMSNRTTETRSNLPEQDVIISEGTDVVGSDGEKVGTVDQVVFDRNGRINGFIVRSGFIFTRDVKVPIDWVAETGQEHIRLNVASDQAEALSYDVEDSTL